MSKPIEALDLADRPAPRAPDEPEVASVLNRIASRVRSTRKSLSMTRQTLSDRSGVSMRYLAQLETAQGNISIVLLTRVALALGLKVEDLVSEGGPNTSSSRKAGRLCLIGLRGAGKSTLGRLIGERLGIEFVELNREIEDQAGMPVSEIIALYGQEGYRRLEQEALNAVAERYGQVVLAVGGGIVSNDETYRLLMERFHTIWVKAKPEEHMARVRAQGDERPMAGNPQAMAQLKSILTDREALYAQADATLDTSGQLLDSSLDKVIAIIEQQGFLR